MFPFVTFHDDILQKVINIIEFSEKFLKAYENTFYNTSIEGSTEKNLIRSRLNEPKNQLGKLKNLAKFDRWTVDLSTVLNSKRFEVQMPDWS